MYAEPDPSMSFHPSQDPSSAYIGVDYTVDYSTPQEEQVDENYDPTEFFSGIGGGIIGEGGEGETELQETNGQHGAENGGGQVSGGRQAGGWTGQLFDFMHFQGGDKLQDDLAFSDDSEEEEGETGQGEDDPMAF